MQTWYDTFQKLPSHLNKKQDGKAFKLKRVSFLYNIYKLIHRNCCQKLL